MSKSEEEIVTIYVSKYATTKGLFSVKAELIDGGKYAKSVGPYGLFLGSYDYSLTFDGAVEQARSKVDAKIKSAKKALAKLQKLRDGKWALNGPK